MDIPQIDSPIIKEAGEKVIKSVQDSIEDGAITSLEELRASIFTKYIEYFQTLGSNPFSPTKFKRIDYRDQTVYNQNQIQAKESLDLLFRESTDLNSSLISQFTLMTESSDQVIGQIKSVTDNLSALKNQVERDKFLSRGKSVLTITDSFVDSTKIDFTKSKISVDFRASNVTLPVTDNKNRATQVLSVEIIDINKNTNGSTVYDEDKLFSEPKAYEGKRFGTSATARPEGGAWRIDTKNTAIDTASPSLNFDENYSSGSGDVFTGTLTEFSGGTSISVNDPVSSGKQLTPENFILDDPTSATATSNYNQPYGASLTREDLKYVEIQATEEQLETSRLKMFDNDPRTFWEIEYTPVIPGLQTELNSQSDANQNNYSNYQLIAQQYLRDNSTDSLQATIKVELDNSYSLNYLDLTPIFFSSADDANYEILEILTQPEDGGIWESIPNFESYDNVIGRSSNDVLSKRDLSQSNTFNKFAFKGKGVWTFPKRKVKNITIKVKQDYAIPTPYVVKDVQLLKKTSYSINESKSATQNESSAFSTQNNSNSLSASELERLRVTRLVQFGYLETIASQLQNDNTALLAGATSGNTSNLSSSQGTDNTNSSGTANLGSIIGSTVAAGLIADSPPNTAGAAIVAGLGAAVDALASSGSSSASNQSSSKSYNDSGFQVNSEYFRTLWSRARYAIGIAEIGMYTKVYVSSGTLYSIPYRVLNGKKELTLSVNEKVPVSFLNYDDQKAFIEYYVVINDVEHRINPIIGTVRSAGHIDFPNSIRLDRETQSEEVTIRFLAKIIRPLESQLLNADSETAILNEYEIKITDV